MTKLRGHAYFVEFAGRRGGPSPWWLALLAAAGIVAQVMGKL